MAEKHTYIPGETDAEKQHLHEHETLQILQRHALNGKTAEFFELLQTIEDPDKRRDIIELCGMQDWVRAVEKATLGA